MYCIYHQNMEVSVINIGSNLSSLSNIYVVDGKGWTGNERVFDGARNENGDFIPIEILPEGGATVAKTMTVKSMIFS